MPVDVLQCQSCGHAALEEDWIAPLLPLKVGACTNCGDRIEGDTCLNCGLTPDESKQVHDELRAMVAPHHNLLNAAREASRIGRRLMALKLATQAARANEDGQGHYARALRIWLLANIGEQQSALEEAMLWVEMENEPPALAWASLGQQQQHANYPGAAAESYHKALQLDPDQHALRARRSLLLVKLGRRGQANAEILRIFEAEADDRSLAMAIQVAEQLVEFYRGAYREDEISRLLERAGTFVQRSAILLAHRARIAALSGETAKARRDLKRAKRLVPELDIYKEVELTIKPQRTSWWRW